MAHPYENFRQSKVEHSRADKITKGYAIGGGIGSDKNAPIPAVKKALKVRDSMPIGGDGVKHSADKPFALRAAGGGVKDTGNRGVADLVSDSQAAQQARENAAYRTSKAVVRAAGGRTNKSKGTNVNVIIAGPHGAAPSVAPAGGAGAAPVPLAPAPRPPMPMAPPGAGPGGPPMPMPPRSAGGRAYAKGGAVKAESERLGTKVQHTPQKNDLKEIGRPRVITYKTGGAVEAPKGKKGMAPHLPGGSRGGEARLAKAHRAAKTYARPK